ncbi:MAG: nucleoside diphosphate kinase regulator [Phenylobacterium sp.]|jgi:regulator of nucleoside diphosphate kinase|uniref:nucleoside diphosphate kinase regulator n=1 Tax=Phenylobacterium sp. TaxID=1871053 RepID=UPI00391AB63A
MPISAPEPARPAIILAETEAERLSALALQAEYANPEIAHLLLEEIDRAEIRPDPEMPDHVVRMHSIVRFVDGAHGRSRTVVLVYPSEADIALGKVSILTHVGSGLIGLGANQQIRWPDRDGRDRLLSVVQVKPPGRLEL